MTNEDKGKLVMALGNFQNDEWDNLSNLEFSAITEAIAIICQKMQKED